MAPRALPRFSATTDPSATLSSSANFPGPPVIWPTLLHQFLGGTRRASPVAWHVLATVPSLPPRRSEPSPQPACGASCCLRPTVGGSASGASHFRGHLCVHFRYGPVTRSPSRGWLYRWASDTRFPSYLPSKLQGLWLLPRQDYLLLNMPAFAGHTTGRESFPSSGSSLCITPHVSRGAGYFAFTQRF